MNKLLDKKHIFHAAIFQQRLLKKSHWLPDSKLSLPTIKYMLTSSKGGFQSILYYFLVITEYSFTLMGYIAWVIRWWMGHYGNLDH